MVLTYALVMALLGTPVFRILKWLVHADARRHRVRAPSTVAPFEQTESTVENDTFSQIASASTPVKQIDRETKLQKRARARTFDLEDVMREE